MGRVGGVVRSDVVDPMNAGATTWRTRAAASWLAFLTMLFLVWRLDAKGGDWTTPLTGAVLAGGAILAMVATLVRGWQRTTPGRAGWLLIAAGCAAWAADRALLFARPARSSAGLTQLAAQIGFAVMVGSLTAGVMTLGAPAPNPEARRKLFLDLMPPVTALLAALWLGVIAPIFREPGASWNVRVVASIHGAGSVLLLVVVLVGILRGSRSGDATSLSLLLCGVATLVAANILWLEPWRAGRTDSGAAADTGLGLAFCWIAIAVSVPEQCRGGPRRPTSRTTRRANQRVGSRRCPTWRYSSCFSWRAARPCSAQSGPMAWRRRSRPASRS